MDRAHLIQNMLLKAKSPEFQPTISFETKLARIFLAKLRTTVELDKEDSICELADYVKLILAVQSKDAKFMLCYLETEQLSSDLVFLIRERHQQLGESYLYYVELMHELLQIPSQKFLISQFGGHHALLSKALNTPCEIVVVLNILGSLSGCSSKIMSEITTMKTIDWICGNVQNIVMLHLDHPQSWGVVMKLLEFSFNIIETNPRAFKNFLSPLFSVIHLLSQKCPDNLKESITGFKRELSMILLESNSENALPSSPTKLSKTNTHFELSVENLHKNIHQFNDLREKFSYPTGNYNSLQHSAYVRGLNPNLDVCIETNSIGNLCLEMLAELVCGMLNSNQGGVIHIGIGKSGKVTGVKLEENARDEFRLSLDNIFHKLISPVIPYRLMHLDFIHVQSERETTLPLWVIRISVPANLNTLFYIKSTQKCFKRCENSNTLLSLQEVRKTAISLIERRNAAPKMCNQNF